jgi:hypothetical protein
MRQSTKFLTETAGPSLAVPVVMGLIPAILGAPVLATVLLVAIGLGPLAAVYSAWREIHRYENEVRARIEHDFPPLPKKENPS